MALKDSRGGREYDKFVADSSGDTAMRMSVTSSVTSATDTDGTVTVAVGNATKALSKAVIAATDVAGKERIGFQFFAGGSDPTPTKDLIVVVWGSLKSSPGVAPGTAWTQIGDNIDVNAGTSSYRAISTTPVKYVAITAYLDNGSPAENTIEAYLMAD